MPTMKTTYIESDIFYSTRLTPTARIIYSYLRVKEYDSISKGIAIAPFKAIMK